jgi:hypothetical protein
MKIKITKINTPFRINLRKLIDKLIYTLINFRNSKYFWYLHTFEPTLTSENLVYMSMQIKKDFTYMQVFSKIFEISKIALSKRQCYKLLELAKSR